MEDRKTVAEDFDRISALGQSKWDHNRHYHGYLVKNLPETRNRCLDVGCGSGEFARVLAGSFAEVEGIDLSEGMLKKARELSEWFGNVRYANEDVMEKDLGAETYDCIVSIAAVHHLPLAESLEIFKRALKPGGVLMILDLYRQETAWEFLTNLAAVPLNLLFTFFRTGRLRRPPEEIRVWDEHAKHDVYSSISEIRAACGGTLPNAAVRRHLFWRYSLIWKKR